MAKMLRSLLYITFASVILTTVTMYYVRSPRPTDEIYFAEIDGDIVENHTSIQMVSTTDADTRKPSEDKTTMISLERERWNSFMPTEKSQQYLFPVQAWEGGPNWNYKNYRIAIEYAMITDRKLVTIPFHIHHTQPHGWLTHGWRQFNETFNVDKLQEIVPLMTPEDYAQQCDGKVEMVLQHPFATKRDISQFIFDYNRTKNSYMELWNIELPDLGSIPRTMNEIKELLEQSKTIKCLGIYRAMDFAEMIERSDTPAVLMDIDRHLERASFIRSLTKRVIPQICQGKPYVSMQWRNKTGEMCVFDMWVPWGELDCSSHFEELRQAAEYVSTAVSQYMKQNNFECVFLTFPPGSEEITQILGSKVQKIVTSAQLSQLRVPGIDEIADDNYFVSLLEQEIATRAPMFIGCNKSSWTQVVSYTRTANDQPTLYLRDIENIPKNLKKLV
ncbi:uncharacterized protein [Ptychodera flava]|uniref:uncharacterized protein n=1 Tax=Ptychodera flava TaxID=63121 RepID=UPI00396A0A2A